MTGYAYGYPAPWVYAAGRGYMAGRHGAEDLYDHPYYRSLLLLSPERYCFRRQFDRGRHVQQSRIARGVEQPPGSTYDPTLDDGRGAMHGIDPREER